MELNGPKWSLSEDQLVGIYVAGFLFILWLFWEFYDDRRSNVPKGSLGYIPFFGDTIEFLKSPEEYTAKRITKYGNIFKGAFLGLRAVVSTDPEFSHIRDVQGKDSFHISLPRHLKAMLGDTYNMSAEQSGLQKLVLSALLPEGLKTHIRNIEALILDSLMEEWEGHVVEVASACKKITRKVCVYMTLGDDPSEKRIRHQIFELIPVFTEGVEAVPIYLPGTLYYEGYQARLKIEKLLARLIRRRKNSSREKPSEGTSKNILDALMRYRTTEGKELSLKQISDVLCTLFLGGQDTSAATMTCTIKELSALPAVRKAALVECNAIEERRIYSDPFTMADIRNMRYVQNMLKETLRKYSIVPFTVRQAKEDVSINGTLVPRGWYAVTMACNMHVNPQFWKDPEVYNPSRFDNPLKPKTYIPFGVGTHMCPGRSLAEVIVSIFLYHLLLKYEWKLDGKVEERKTYKDFNPIPVPKDEIRIRVKHRQRGMKQPRALSMRAPKRTPVLESFVSRVKSEQLPVSPTHSSLTPSPHFQAVRRSTTHLSYPPTSLLSSC